MQRHAIPSSFKSIDNVALGLAYFRVCYTIVTELAKERIEKQEQGIGPKRTLRKEKAHG